MGAGASKRARHVLHIIKVVPGSAADRAGLLPIFQYVVSVNGMGIASAEDIGRIMAEWEKGEVQMEVYDARTKETSAVRMKKEKAEKIGFSVKLHSDTMSPVTFKVLEVEYNSPAIEARLQANQDYVIAHDGGAFTSVFELESLLYKNRGGMLELWVYNVGMAVIKKVQIRPTENGEIGCALGLGLLNEVEGSKEKIEIVEGITEGVVQDAVEDVVQDAKSSNNDKNKSSDSKDTVTIEVTEEIAIEAAEVAEEIAIEEEVEAEEETGVYTEDEAIQQIQQMHITEEAQQEEAQNTAHSTEMTEEARMIEQKLYESLKYECYEEIEEVTAHGNEAEQQKEDKEEEQIDHTARIKSMEVVHSTYTTKTEDSKGYYSAQAVSPMVFLNDTAAASKYLHSERQYKRTSTEQEEDSTVANNSSTTTECTAPCTDTHTDSNMQ